MDRLRHRRVPLRGRRLLPRQRQRPADFAPGRRSTSAATRSTSTPSRWATTAPPSAPCGSAPLRLQPRRRRHPTTCLRCGKSGINDVGQRFETIELTRVSAFVRRDESRIDDSNDERVRAGFAIVTAADVDPQTVQHRWYTTGGWGGVPQGHGRALVQPRPRRHTAGEITIAGNRLAGPRFRICEACGHLDRTGLANKRDEHRPWCKHRHSHEEHTRSVLLTRKLTTEGVVLTLPQGIAFGDDVFAVPSLTAAVLLGLRENYGGAPDHLDVAFIKDPLLDNRDALLLHDLVPGGTGYLAELADPASCGRC
ncbi:hypothetical protein G7085_20395 [Tessaracoccus sp. HDW20]|nr:hypothetical protein [Tessaracoccus coleopterorum]NHB86088.1 hypothetical protein [Tessaracoccus coleopterorum]